MRVYECIIDCGNDAIKTDIAARNKNELLDEWGGNGEFVRIIDVTSKYTFSEHRDWFTELQEALAGKFSEGEIRLICALVDEQIKRVEGCGTEENRTKKEDYVKININKDFKKIFSRNLNDLFLEYDKKQADFARATGVSTQLISLWCQGRSIPRKDGLKKIADYFGVSISSLFEEDNTYKEVEGSK